jgi:hypothetical protein
MLDLLVGAPILIFLSGAPSTGGSASEALRDFWGFMRRFITHSLVVGILCGRVWLALSNEPVIAADNQKLLQADRAFLEAVAKTDKMALGKLLDADFTWTDSDGRTQTRAQVLQDVPKLGISDGDGAEVRNYTYAEVGVIEANRGRAHALRVWVKRPEGWRVIVHQTVTSLDAPPSFSPGAGNNCENPCETVPFKPKDEREREVITAYERLESAAVAHDSAKFSAYVGDEFAAASSNGDKMFDKRSRMADFDRSKMGGIAPTPLVSARMFAFGDAVIMTSLHRPDRGRPLHVTRVWVKRDGKWVETVSYQTAIKAHPTKP